MVKEAFTKYYLIIICISLVSNFIKFFVPSTDYAIGIALVIACFVLNVFLFAFKNKENRQMNIMALSFFVLSVILLSLELVSLDYPILNDGPRNIGANEYYEPHSDMLSLPNSALMFIYHSTIVLKIVYIINCVCFSVFFGVKAIKN